MQMVLKIIEGSDWERKEFNWKDRTKANWSYGGQSEVNIRDECKFKNHVELPGMENPKKVWFEFLSFGNILNGQILGGFQGILGFIFGLCGSCFQEFLQVQGLYETILIINHFLRSFRKQIFSWGKSRKYSWVFFKPNHKNFIENGR